MSHCSGGYLQFKAPGCCWLHNPPLCHLTLVCGYLVMCWVWFCLDIRKRKWLFIFGSGFQFKPLMTLYPNVFISFLWLENIRKDTKGGFRTTAKLKTLAEKRPEEVWKKKPLKYYQTSIELVLTLFSYFSANLTVLFYNFPPSLNFPLNICVPLLLINWRTLLVYGTRFQSTLLNLVVSRSF